MTPDFFSLVIPDEGLTFDDFEREIIIYALYLCEWNKSEACRMLDISSPRLYRMMEKHHITIEKPSFINNPTPGKQKSKRKKYSCDNNKRKKYSCDNNKGRNPLIRAVRQALLFSEYDDEP